jgi:uncharacterized protein
MEILNHILQSIKTDAPITEVRRGLHWTAVVSKFCGLSSTLAADACDHGEGDETGSLTDVTALQLAQRCLSDDIGTASLGIAALNSLMDVDIQKCADMDGLKLVYAMGKDKNISVIGHFPALEKLAGIARNLWIIEKHPRPGDLPEESGKTYLPLSDIIVISGTTLINHTLPGILSLCAEKSVKMLLGPTTPMSEALFEHGIDALSGSIVTDKEAALKLVSEGVSFMRIKKSGAVRFVTKVKDRQDIIRRTGNAI